MLLVYVYKCRFALCLFVHRHTLEFIRLNFLASEHKDPPISDCLALAFRYLPSQLAFVEKKEFNHPQTCKPFSNGALSTTSSSV